MKKVFQALDVVFILWLGVSFGASPALSGASDVARNKQLVQSFYEEVFVHHKVTEAAKMYLAEDYKQHNPNVPDGRQAFIDFFLPYFKKHPQARSEIKRVVAEGDLVVLHVHSKQRPTQKGSAIVDIFRVAEGKIVEHWDVIQALPEKSANDNTMF